MDNKGYIKLNRKFFQNPLWNEARVYSRAEAWIDLLQLAGFEASTAIINGKVIEIQRGELPASRRYLELRWDWSNTKVSNFLKLLSDLGMITTRNASGQTIVKLAKYNVYNDTETTENASKTPEERQGSASKTPEERQNKEIKERKKNNNPPTPLKGGATSFDFSFVKDEFSEPFQTWLSYKKEKKQTYKTQKSIQACYSHLVNLAHGDAETAKLIVEQSMANNWAGIFELKASKANKKNEISKEEFFKKLKGK